LFGDKLTPEQPFDFRESDWEEVAMVLDKNKRRDKLGIWFWPALLGVLSIATVIWLFNDLQNTKRLVEKLENQTYHNNIIITDTIRKKVTVIEYDTIRKTIISEEKPLLKTTAKKIRTEKETKISWTTTKTFTDTTTGKDCDCSDDELLKTENGLLNSPLIESIKETSEKNNLVDNKLQATQKERQTKSNLFHPLSIDALIDSMNVKPREVTTPEIVTVPSKRILKSTQEKQFKIGIVAGYQFPKEQGRLVSDTIGNQIYKSYQIGLRTEYNLTDHWTISADFTHQKLNYRVNGLDTIEGVFIERELPDGLDTIRIQQKNWNYAIGLKYRFGKNSKIQPYGSLYLHAKSTLRQDGKGQIRNYGDPVFFEEKRSDSNFRLQGLEPSMGFNYRLKRNLSWQLEGHYLFHFNEKIDRLRNGFGFRTALMVHF